MNDDISLVNDDISVQVLHQRFRGGWGVLALADFADAGGGGGSKI